MLFTILAVADQRAGLQGQAPAARRAQTNSHTPTNRPRVAPPPAPSPSVTSTATDLPAACRQQAQQFHAVTTEEVALARHTMQSRLNELDIFLHTIGSRERAWRDYLLWKQTRELAASNLHDPAILEKLEDRWGAALAIWNAPQLLRASVAVRTYLGMTRTRAANETAEQYAAVWNELADLLAAHQHGNKVDLSRIAAVIAARERLVQAPLLTAAIRRELSRPDIVLTLKNDWLQSQFTQVIDEPFQVNGVIAGSRAYGAGQMTGKVSVSVVPSADSARWSLDFAGTSVAATTTTDRGVTVRSHATARLQANKIFTLDPTGLSAAPSTATAATSIAYDRISSGGRPIRRQIATRQTYARQGEAERDSAAMAKRSLATRLDQEGNALITKVNEFYRANLRDNFLSADRRPPSGRVSANAAGIRAEWLLPRSHTFATIPPRFDAATGVAISMNATAMEEFLLVSLGGRRLTPEQVIGELFGQTVVRRPNDSKQWLEFATKPCDVELGDGILRLVFHLAALESGDTRYPAVMIEMKYRVAQRDGRLALVRLGDLVARFDAEDQASERTVVSGRRQTLQVALRRTLGKVLIEELLWPKPEQAGTKSPMSSMSVAAVSVADGWLQMALGTKTE